ncbi:MAG: ribosome biogenesis factor YjgA [Stenotrophobium sp.]
MPRRSEQIPEADDSDEGLSKTQIKNAMLALQDLGAALLELPDDQLDTLGMDDRLRDALRELRRLTNHGARKRQLQYVGKLMRDADVEPFRRALAAKQAGEARNVLLLKEIEAWRERLLAGDEGWAMWIKAYPAGDTAQLRALVSNARREKAQALATAEKNHTEPRNGRFFRELFKSLQAVMLATNK